MGIYENLSKLGYILEEFDLDRLRLEHPYKNKEGKIYFLIKKEDINEEIHKKIMEEEIWVMKEIIDYKWSQSKEARKNVGLYEGAIHWLEQRFGKNFYEEYKKNCIIHVKNNEQLCDEHSDIKSSLRYSLIVEENGDNYFILRKANGRKEVFDNYIQIAEMIGKENRLKWIEDNASHFRRVLEECVVHGRREDECYISYKNLEKRKKELID